MFIMMSQNKTAICVPSALGLFYYHINRHLVNTAVAVLIEGVTWLMDLILLFYYINIVIKRKWWLKKLYISLLHCSFLITHWMSKNYFTITFKLQIMGDVCNVEQHFLTLARPTWLKWLELDETEMKTDCLNNF